MNKYALQKRDDSGLVPFFFSLWLELDGLFNELFDSFWRTPEFLQERNWRYSDVTEDETSVSVAVDLPGFKKEQVKVTAQNGGVVVTAKSDKSSYTRSFYDSRVDYSKSEVKLEDGVLTIKTPKREEAKAKELTIS